ncbi:transcription factor MAMYB [Vigna unguiculata]|uniref:DnaJ-like protein subfamily C member 2 n=1 Tax=Vigna unguiculata TaxID=3917 RepID=A0A4D6L8L5_VIGUN|nr:transcription factor MAMYB [Vigna unguiculata]QCD84806.1 DnaJ-like protein subfamily C member 2 [Vigna unguiculata]
MEFLDEDARPRFVFQSGAVASTEPPHPDLKPTKPFLFVTISLSSLFLALSLFFLESEPFKSLLFWLALSLLIGPFAPPSLTGGDVRVGLGEVVNFPDPEPETDDDARKPSQRRSRQRRPEEVAAIGPVVSVGAAEKRGGGGGVEKVATVVEEKDWREEDVEVLKKQLVKNPVGKPGRWEAIAAAFGGRHGVESVIKKAKELGEKKVDDSDSYALFLKNRKTLDKRVVEENGGEDSVTVDKAVDNGWSSGEDIALLNALKVFPKDVSMRWEKVAAAVPGRSKAACMRRFTELKKGFRNAKAANE